MPLQPPRLDSASSADIYWFILGRERAISASEIEALFTTSQKNSPSFFQSDSLPILKMKGMPCNSKTTIRRLGGTIKIAKEIRSNISETELCQEIIKELHTVEGKINFGLSFYTETGNDTERMHFVKNIGKKIKHELKTKGLSVRYVENRDVTLSSVTVEKNNLTGRGREFLIQQTLHHTFSLAKTEAVQPFEDFNLRDFGRPGRDDVSGMLPPKLAMMMINLAQQPTTATILDPFCGSGTILSEALLLGYKHIIGTDSSVKAIEDSTQNISWTAKQFGIDLADITINTASIQAENLDRTFAPHSIHAIIAEPYMGKPLKGRETQKELEEQVYNLKKLYLDAFAQFYKILKPGGIIVFLIPRFRWQNDWIKIDCLKEILSLGFKSKPFFENRSSLLYARPEQRVGREIWRFTK